MLNKIVRKSILKSSKLIIAIFLLFMLSQTLLIVSQTTYNNVESSLNKLYEKTNREDFRIYTIEELEEKYNKEREKEIEKKFDLKLEKKEYKSVMTNIDNTYNILKYNEKDTINKIDLVQGTLPKKDNEIFLMQPYMQRNNLNVGDTYKIDSIDYKISGSGYIVDYVTPIDILTGDSSIGTDLSVQLYMNANSYEKIRESSTHTYFSGIFNNSNIDKKEEYKKITSEYTYNVPLLDENGKPEKDKSGAIVTKSVSLIPFILDVDINPTITGVKKTINGQRFMFNTLSKVILFIVTIILIILFNNIFNSQKKEIGILKAEGITKKELALRYTIGLYIILILATFPALYFGAKIRSVLIGLFTNQFNIPMYSINDNFLTLAIFFGMITIIMIIIVVYFLSIKKQVIKEPILLLKNIDYEKPPKIKLKKITKNMSFINKYKINILLRNYKITILLIFGVFISSFLLIMGGSVRSSLNEVLNDANNKYFTYDYEINYDIPSQNKEYNNNSLIHTPLTISNLSGNKIINDNISQIMLMSYNFENNEYINILDENNESLKKDKIYITSLAQKIYKLSPGDYIRVKNPYDHTKSITLEVAGIVDIGGASNVYMDIELAQQLFDLADNFANAQVIIDDGSTFSDENAAYIPRLDSSESLKMLKMIMNIITGFISLVAIVISVITLSIITNIIVTKSKKIISIMKVLGYTNKEVNSMIISPYKWILIFVYFVSIPLFKVIIQTIISYALKDIDIAVKVKIPFEAIISGFIAIFIVYLISMFITRISVNKIELSESLKVDE